MSSEQRGLVRFQEDDPLRYNCVPSSPPQRRVGDPGPKTRELTGFIDHSLDRDRYFTPHTAELRRPFYGGEADGLNWNRSGCAPTPSGDGSDEDDDEDDDEDGDDEVDGLVSVDDAIKPRRIDNNNTTGTLHSGADKIGNIKSKHQSSFGLGKNGVSFMKSMGSSTCENHQHGQLSNYQNAVTIAEPDGDMYYSQYLQSAEGTAPGQKDLVGENGYGFNGRKDATFACDSGASLKAIFSDPVTGTLMDDAMILPCGHSFGSGGAQHVIRTKACYTCSQSVSEDSIAPNLSLRAAVQAFHREEELQFYRSSKRRRDRFDQEKGGYSDSAFMDLSRGRGVQFPFVVTDRVIIKGNKRTPQRFVGREAVVTTQCLNGWYVVKTLDNAESVKLQYRSLAKVSNGPCEKLVSSKMTPNWL